MPQETAASDRIALLIGETTFNTTLATIAPSSVLTRLINLQAPSQDPYFIDADPTLFTHVLRYLRTGMFPLFYDHEKGHDETQYLALLNQARFYEIPKLEDWLTNKTYLDCVQRRTWAKSMTLCGESQIEHMEELTHLRNERLTILNVEQSQQKCYRCPTSNWRHDGRKTTCIQSGCVHRDKVAWASIYEVQMKVLKIDYIVTAMEVVHPLLSPGDDGQPSVPPPYHSDPLGLGPADQSVEQP